jgi:glycosyltransferase involved in cell wall biosynthesis
VAAFEPAAGVGSPGHRRVLLVGKGPPERGGIAAFLQSLLRSEPSLSYRIDLVNLTREEVPQGGRLTASNVTRTLSDARKVWRASRTADLVHVHSALAPQVTLLRAGLLALAARLRGCRVLVHAHGGRIELRLASPAQRLVARLALRPAHRVVAVSSGVRSALVRALGPERVVLIDNGVDASAFGPPGPPNDPPRVLYAGGLTPRKGVVDLLRASALLRERGIHHEVLLAGGMPDEGPRAEAEVRAAAGPDVKFLPPQPHERMADLYRSVDVFSLPSWWEGMPLTVLEAMATGLPVVATPVGDIHRAVEDGVTGRLVPPRDPEALADALEALLVDPDLRRRMGEAGRRKVEGEFDAKATSRALSALYAEVSSG